VDPDSALRAILPSAALCMRVTPGYPYKVGYRHRWQGYGKRRCRRCGVLDEPKKRKKR